MSRLLEIACFNREAARIAFEAGAHRIELCSNYSVGGITPAQEDFTFVKKNVSVPVFVMIRPRSGNFQFTDEEFEYFNMQISHFKSLGADGFVFGILTPENKLDIQRNSQLVKLAHPLPCTLHRAIDESPDLLASLENAIGCGFKRILTAGGKGNARENSGIIKQLISQARDRITILPGGGIRSSNVKKLIEETGCTEIHSAAITQAASDLPDAAEIKQLLQPINR